VRKTDTALRDALQRALDLAQDDGGYAKVLHAWDVDQGALAEANINGGT
jgi:polar amino acid transport system substrate-binding protein